LTDALPKTRSGKIMRRLLRAIARGEEITQDMSTLENPAIVAQLRGEHAVAICRAPKAKHKPKTVKAKPKPKTKHATSEAFVRCPAQGGGKPPSKAKTNRGLKAKARPSQGQGVGPS
jgi:hypothetical protein